MAAECRVRGGVRPVSVGSRPRLSRINSRAAAPPHPSIGSPRAQPTYLGGNLRDGFGAQRAGRDVRVTWTPRMRPERMAGGQRSMSKTSSVAPSSLPSSSRASKSASLTWPPRPTLIRWAPGQPCEEHAAVQDADGFRRQGQHVDEHGYAAGTPAIDRRRRRSGCPRPIAASATIPAPGNRNRRSTAPRGRPFRPAPAHPPATAHDAVRAGGPHRVAACSRSYWAKPRDTRSKAYKAYSAICTAMPRIFQLDDLDMRGQVHLQ